MNSKEYPHEENIIQTIVKNLKRFQTSQNHPLKQSVRRLSKTDLSRIKKIYRNKRVKNTLKRMENPRHKHKYGSLLRELQPYNYVVPMKLQTFNVILYRCVVCTKLRERNAHKYEDYNPFIKNSSICSFCAQRHKNESRRYTL